MAALGYSVSGAIGSNFNTTYFMNRVLPDWGIYVHSHGDNYWAASGYPNVDSAFLQDPGPSRCNNYSVDSIRSSAIKSATHGSLYNLVIMSTCFLGSNSSTMPNAFQIAKVKNSTRREFYLGYVYETYDSAALRFEGAFWSYISGSPPSARRSLYSAFIYASSIGGYDYPNSSNPFQANWWGNPNYTGTPG
jgi:hypothetical protein